MNGQFDFSGVSIPDNPGLEQVKKNIEKQLSGLKKNLTLRGMGTNALDNSSILWQPPLILQTGQLAVILIVPTYLGILTFYIVCNPDYPQTPPEQVYMELVSSERANGLPVSYNYDGYIFNHWRSENTLADIVRDGLLQIEEIVLS